MAPRARRRRSRYTPRRWLPFLALSALIAGAALLDTDRPPVAPERLDPSLDITAVPSVARADAISTAFYCAGGTAQGEDGPAELSLVFANDADTGATAEVTVLSDTADPATTEVEVPANGRARLRLGEVVQADWVGAVVDVRGGRVAVDREVSGPLGYDAAPCATTAADRWYVPSGSTRRGSELYLSLTNPFPDAASVEVSFATDRGTRTPRSLRRFSVPGRSVRVVSVADLVTERAEVAATVRVRAGRVVVDRVQTSDGEGDPIPIEGTEATTPAPKGLVSTPASPVRAPCWIVPSARTGTGVRTQIAVANPSGRDARVDVLLRYQEPERYAELAPVELTVRAGGEEVVDLAAITDLAADANVWVDVRSLDEVPIVVERTTAYADPSQVRGVATALGSPAAATRWLVTQAGSSRSRNGAVLVTNPGARPAAIRAYSLESGVRRELPAASVTVPAGDRRSLDLSEAGAAASIIVEADTGVVVGSSLAVTSGPGVALQPGLPYPEDLVSIVAPG